VRHACNHRPRLNAAADARGGVSLQQVHSCCIACGLARTPVSWKAARAVPCHWQKKVATGKMRRGAWTAGRPSPLSTLARLLSCCGLPAHAAAKSDT
jgi:hypothetical protein